MSVFIALILNNFISIGDGRIILMMYEAINCQLNIKQRLSFNCL